MSFCGKKLKHICATIRGRLINPKHSGTEDRRRQTLGWKLSNFHRDFASIKTTNTKHRYVLRFLLVFFWFGSFFFLGTRNKLLLANYTRFAHWTVWMQCACACLWLFTKKKRRKKLCKISIKTHPIDWRTGWKTKLFSVMSSDLDEREIKQQHRNRNKNWFQHFSWYFMCFVFIWFFSFIFVHEHGAPAHKHTIFSMESKTG